MERNGECNSMTFAPAARARRARGGFYVREESCESCVLASAELYNPSTRTFSPTGNMNFSRAKHAATAVKVSANNEVLIDGGAFSAQGELYNPSNGSFTITGSMTTARVLNTATLLGNGKVLVTGGWVPGTFNATASADLYDPSTGLFTATGNMTSARAGHAAPGR